MPRARVRLVALLVVLIAALPRLARAQVHWDGAIEAGAMKRVTTSRADGVHDVGVGPMLEAHAHVALLPMLRLGAWAGGDLSPSDEPKARRVYTFGLRAKLTPPATWGARAALRAYLFTGVGYALVYDPSFTTTLQAPDAAGNLAPQTVYVPAAGGRFLEIPVGVGAAWRLRRPWELTLELFGRVGLANGGTIYQGSPPTRPASPATGTGLQASGVDVAVSTPGMDSWAFGLAVGVGFDQ